MEDKEIIQLLFRRDEAALAAAQSQYGAYCAAVAGKILRAPEDREECLNDVWVSLWNAVPPESPGNLRLYLAAITRNLAFDRVRRLTAQKRGGMELQLALDELAECLPGGRTPEDALDTKELGQTLNCFLATLRARDRQMFVRRYFFTDSVAEIAARFSVREANVYMILSRTRKKCREYLEQEGYTT